MPLERKTFIENFDLIISHGNCYDGVTAAAVAKKHSPNAEVVFAQHGDTPPNVTGKRALIVDFSYNRGVLERLAEEAESLLLLDHHKKSQEDLEGLDYAIFDMKRSGAGLAWDFLFPGEKRPDLVNYVEDRDLFKFRLPYSREHHAGLSANPLELRHFMVLLEADIAGDNLTEGRIASGKMILAFTHLTAEKFADRAGVCLLINADVECACVNVPVEFVCETAEILYNRNPDRPVLCWSWDAQRGDIYCSLRSHDDGPDVCEIAKTYGGGGHKHAAGFRTSFRMGGGLGLMGIVLGRRDEE